MKINTYLKTISIIVAIICLMTSTPFASKGDPQSDIKHKLKTNDKLEIGTILHFSFGVTPMQLTCDEIDVSVETVGSITYFGQTFWSVPYKDREETLYSFDIQLQADDTCGLLINLSCGDFTTTINRHFITTSDSVEMIIGRLPTFSNEYIRPDYEGRIGNVIPGEFPEDDSLYGIPENPTMIDYERDSSYQMTKEEAQLRKMHRLEQEPLTDKDIQYHSIGNIRYERKRGEYQFTKIKTYTNEEIRERHLKRMDSLRTNPPNHLNDMTINLTNEEDYEIVKQFIDSLIPTDSVGFYRAIVNKSMLNELTFNKIKYDRTNRKKIVNLREEKDRPAPKKKTD